MKSSIFFEETALKNLLVLSLLGISLQFSGQSVNVKLKDVFAVKQPDGMSCWAASFTMMYSWKNKMSIPIEAALATVKDGQKFVNIFKLGQGISKEQETDFCKKAGLKIISQFNPSISGWASLLTQNGPLSVTVGEQPPNAWTHALVLIGVKGDGSPGGTQILYIDPADGKEYSKAFSDFVMLYEGSINWPNQIIHY